MWDDVKKLSGLLYRQTGEQKDILLLKLRITSYSGKRDSALARLGGLAYKTIKSGKTDIGDDKEIRAEMEKLDDIDEEIKKANKKLEELRVKTADERGEIAGEVGKAWKKTKNRVSAARTARSAKTKKPAKPEEPEAPPPKAAAEKNAPKKGVKKDSKEPGGKES